MANPMSQEAEECHHADSVVGDKRHELVEDDSDLDEDNDDDDVRDVSEVVNLAILAKKKDSSLSGGHSHNKVSKENKQKISSKNSKDNILKIERPKEDDSLQTRSHSNAITSLSPTQIGPPPFPPEGDTNYPETNPTPREENNFTTDVLTKSPTRKTTPPPFPPENKTTPNSEQHLNANPGAQRPTEVSL